eukprot:gene1941-5029_t
MTTTKPDDSIYPGTRNEKRETRKENLLIRYDSFLHTALPISSYFRPLQQPYDIYFKYDVSIRATACQQQQQQPATTSTNSSTRSSSTTTSRHNTQPPPEPEGAAAELPGAAAAEPVPGAAAELPVPAAAVEPAEAGAAEAVPAAVPAAGAATALSTLRGGSVQDNYAVNYEEEPVLFRIIMRFMAVDCRRNSESDSCSLFVVVNFKEVFAKTVPSSL